MCIRAPSAGHMPASAIATTRGYSPFLVYSAGSRARSDSARLGLRAPGRPLRLLLMAVVFAISIANASAVVRSLFDSEIYLKDFTQDYLLTRAFADHADPYVPIATLGARYAEHGGFFDKLHPTPHPPTVALVLWPLAGTSYEAAVRVWFVVQLACLVAGLVLTARVAELRVRPAIWPLFVVLMLAWTPLALEIELAQFTLPIFALLAAALWALSNGRGSLAGVLLGASLALKPLAWPWLLVLVWKRMWVAVGTAIATVVATYVAVMLVIGVGPVASYFGSVLPAMSAGYRTEPTNISLWSVGPKLFSSVDGGAYASLPAAWATAVAGIVPIVALCLCCLWLAIRRPELRQAVAAMTCATVLLNPISWEYCLVLLIVPVFVLAAWFAVHRFPRAPLTATAALALVFLVADVARYARGESGPQDAALMSMLGTMGLMALLMSLPNDRLSVRSSHLTVPEAAHVGVCGSIYQHQ